MPTRTRRKEVQMMVQIPTQTNPTMMTMRGEGSPPPSLNMIFLNLSMDHYPSVRKRSVFDTHRKMRRVRRHESPRDSTFHLIPRQGSTDPFPFPPDIVPTPSLPDPLTGGSRTTKGVAGTPAPAQAPARTKVAANSCTPSPTKSLAPSASRSSVCLE